MHKLHLGIIKWDQKLGGVVECIYPSLNITANSAMNIYNLHRMRQTDPGFGTVRIKLKGGESYNIISFFSGFGGTSPDGFTANYGKNIVGISERVIALFLPMDFKAQEYEEVVAKIAGRILLDQEKICERCKKVQEIIIKSSVWNSAEKLYEFLEKYLDHQLHLSSEEIKTAKDLELKALHYLIKDKNEAIKDLTINPAHTAYRIDSERIGKAKEQEQQIKTLMEQIQQLNLQKQMTEIVSQQKDEMIQTMQADYIKIFGTLTDQILQLENEIRGISESTQGLVNDLNAALAEKIARINELEEEIKRLKMEKEH